LPRPDGEGRPAHRRARARPGRAEGTARHLHPDVRGRGARRGDRLRGLDPHDRRGPEPWQRGRGARRRSRRRDQAPALDPLTSSAPLRPSATPLGGPIVHLDVTGSTNDHAHTLALAGAPDGTLVLAEEQTAGRGRQGRVWWAPRGRSLTLSIVMRLEPA